VQVGVKQLELQEGKLNLSKDEVKMKFFESHFKIIQKNFRSKKYRMDAEAFFIRMNRPTLNKLEELCSSVYFEFGMFYFS
jgi:hypothetical protein